MKKRRLDEIVLQQGLAQNIGHARSLIMAGQVLVNDQLVDKAGTILDELSIIRLKEQSRYVSRGGEKLEAALVHFAIAAQGRVALDIGASSGGFTDCLLQKGALKVYALDVGDNQLDWKLRSDNRVVPIQLNAKDLERLDKKILTPLPDLVTIDVSFISARVLLEKLKKVVSPTAEMLVLVKPQFELPSADVSDGGVVRDPELHLKACELVAKRAEEIGLNVSEPFLSPVTGKKAGNNEFFLRLTQAVK